MPRRAAVLATIGVLSAAMSSYGGTFTVSSTSDSGNNTLRDAIGDANASATPPDTISFSLDPDETITLASDLEAIDSATLVFATTATTTNLTIEGNDTILFQNASTNHDVTFAAEVTYDGGKLNFTEASTGMIAGTLNGLGVALSKKGAGITVSSGLINLDTASSVSIDEGTFAVDGTLTGAGTLTVAAPATLTVAGTVSANDVTDSGTIDVASSGQLNATNSLLVASSGNLLIDAGGAVNTNALTNHGTVVANGALTAGSLVIASDGVLTGNAGNVTAPVNVSGRVAPSTATGTLGISGPVTFGPTSTFEVDIGPGGTGDLLNVTGATVTIQPGARLAIAADPDQIGASSSRTVLTSTGGISGQFIATDFAFFEEDLDYQPNSLTVTLTSTGQNFTSFAGTPNQLAVAEVLDAALPTATGDLQTVFDALETAQADEIAPLLDAIGGESLTAFATARQILAERTSRALQRRVRDPAWGDGRAFYLSEDPDVAAQGDERPLLDRVRPGVWLDGLGLYGELDGDTGEAEVDTLLYGGTVGADAWIADHFVAGLAAGYARSDVDLNDRDTDVYGDTVQGALYAGFVDPRGYVSAYGRYAYTFEDSKREIESSVLNRTARADFDAEDYGAGGEAGITVFSYEGFALQPIAGVDWLRMTEENYTEHGAGDLNLVVDPKDLETTATHFGARVFGRFDMRETGILVPELRAFYQHLYGDRERVLDARLSGAPGLGITGVRGPELPRENLIVGVGWGVQFKDAVTVSLDYDAVLGSDRVEHQANIAARVLF